MSNLSERDSLLQMSDGALLKLCTVDHFIATGKGGQKKNKTSSAVRITHNESDISASASDDRQQSVNKVHALRKLRVALAMEMRCEPQTWNGQFDMNLKNSQYPLFAACLVDHLSHHNWQVSEAAKSLNLSTGKLIKIISKDDNMWQKVNSERQRHGFKILKK